jgi:predicted PurR-regulated permease PerM
MTEGASTPSGATARAIPRWLDQAAALSWRFLLVAAAVAVVIVALSRLVAVVIPVVVATMFATVLIPPVRWLRRHRWPALAATWVVFLIALAAFAGLMTWLVPTIASEITSVGNTATRGVHKVQHWLVTGPFDLSRRDVRHYTNEVGDYFSSHAGGFAVQGATLAIEIIVGALLSLVVAFFLVKDADKITASALRLVGDRAAQHCRALGAQCWANLSGYIRGTTVNGLINGVLMTIGLFALGLPLAVPIGVLTFFGGYLPIVGSIVTGGLAALIALVVRGPVTALIVIGMTIVIHNVEAYLIGPLILGRAVHLHPLVVVLAQVAGAVIAGVIGAFVAVPMVAIAVTVVNYYRYQAGTPGPHVILPADPDAPP